MTDSKAAAVAFVPSAGAAAAPPKPRLYGSYLSTPARGVMHYIAECCPDAVDVEDVDFGRAAHTTAAFMRVNPMKKVPALRDRNGFTLSESSAILLYVAEQYGPASTLPRIAGGSGGSAAVASTTATLRAWARVVSVMEQVHSNVSRFFPGGLVYPQLFPNGRKDDDALHAELLRLGAVHGTRQFALLDHMLSQSKFLAGDEKTVADYYALSVLYLAVCIDCDLTPFVHLSRWLKAMTSTAAFTKVYTPLIDWSKSAAVKVQRVAKRMTEAYVGWNGVDPVAAVNQLRALMTVATAATTAAAAAVDDTKASTPTVKPAAVTSAAAAATTPKGPRWTLYCSPYSAPSRAVMHFVRAHTAALGGGAVTLVDVNLGAGQQHTPAFRQRVNVHGLVPVLVEHDSETDDDGSKKDGSERNGWQLTESAAIIRYLALRVLSADAAAGVGYAAADIEQRARTNERIAWFNSTFMALHGYHMAFAQTTQRAEWSTTTTAPAAAGTLPLQARNAAAAKVWALREFDALEHVWLRDATHSAAASPWLLGATNGKSSGSGSGGNGSGNSSGSGQPTLSDLFGHALVSAGWFIGTDLAEYAAISRWSQAVLASEGGAATYTPFREWLATNPFGATEGLVAVRPTLAPAPHWLVRTRIPLLDAAAFRTLLTQHIARLRGVDGVLHVRVDVATPSAYAGPGSGTPRSVATVATTWRSRLAYTTWLVAALNGGASSRGSESAGAATQVHELMRSWACVDAVGITTEQSELTDI